MTIYVNNDIQANFSGIIQLDGKGDVQLATSLETYKSAANFVLRTDYGDYSPDRQVGCNLGSFIGEPNSRSTHEHMEYNIQKVLKERVFSPLDTTVDVVPVDIDIALCVVRIGGMYDVSGELRSYDSITLTYAFPYIEGTATPLTIA